MDYLIIFFLSFIILLTFLKELKVLDFLSKRYFWSVQFLPNWSFFAPRPNSFDYHLLYRNLLDDGTVQDWQDIPEISENKRPSYAFLYNPSKRLSKSFVDIVLDLASFSNRTENATEICTSLPYLQILHYIDAFPHESSVKSIQFTILRNSKLYDYEVMFVSEMHQVTKNKSG